MSKTNVSCGIVGLPNVGKSTLFQALTKKQVSAENYPFCTIDPNLGIVEVIDERLDTLAVLSKSQKIVYATVAFVDIAGLVKGASKGEGLGNKFLTNIRETDAIIHVVRCFENEEIIHVEGKIDPIHDIEIINLELILSDLELAENAYRKIEKQAKAKKEFAVSASFLQKAIEHLNKEKPIRSLQTLTEEEEKCLKIYTFLTAKKVLYVANVQESDLPTLEENKFVQAVTKYAENENSLVIPLCAKLESEIAQFDKAEAKEFLNTLGLKESGLDKLIRAAFSLLDLVTYLTTGEMETKAWTITKRTPAAEAAGKIHSDLEKGFIRAEVISFDEFVKYHGRVGAKEAGRARSEGKEYVVQDGDVILFFHN
ncbi:MAG: redox-regulated ATPase YchF [Chlamydiota bacterium]